MDRKKFNILVFEDKLGITPAYKTSWHGILLNAGLMQPEYRFYYAKSYRQFSQRELLTWKGNRKTPGFNEDPAIQIRLLRWVWSQIELTKANVIVLMDPALFFLVNQDWNQATTELLRGGQYKIKTPDRQDIVVFVMAAISSLNRGMKPKDVAAINNGFSSKEEWDETYGSQEKVAPVTLEVDEDESTEDSDDTPDEEDEAPREEFLFPVVIPYGKYCFRADVQKLGHILREENDKLDSTIRRVTR